jgi:hypothetical protein
MFQKNFAKFEVQVDADVRAAAPDVRRSDARLEKKEAGLGPRWSISSGQHYCG